MLKTQSISTECIMKLPWNLNVFRNNVNKRGEYLTKTSKYAEVISNVSFE